MDIKQGQLVTTGSTDTTQILITDLIVDGAKRNFFIKVVSGTIKFSVDTVPVPATQNGYTSADTVPPFECYNGHLYFLAASGADTFVITATSV